MNFTTSKTTILKHLQTLSKVVPLRSTLPILSCVYLDSDGLAEIDLGNCTNYNPQEALNMFFQKVSDKARSFTKKN